MAFDQAFQLLQKCFGLGPARSLQSVCRVRRRQPTQTLDLDIFRLLQLGRRQKTYVYSTKLLYLAFCTPFMLQIRGLCVPSVPGVPSVPDSWCPCGVPGVPSRLIGQVKIPIARMSLCMPSDLLSSSLRQPSNSRATAEQQPTPGAFPNFMWVQLEPSMASKWSVTNI